MLNEFIILFYFIFTFFFPVAIIKWFASILNSFQVSSTARIHLFLYLNNMTLLSQISQLSNTIRLIV